MRLSRLFLVYVLSTAAAMAIPFALGGFDYALRSAKPVNSEPALEATPAVYEVANSGNSQYALPACIGHDATEYYGERGYFYADAQTGNKRYFTEDVWSSHFHSCAIGTDGTVYALASTDRGALLNTYTPSGNLKWRISLPEVFSRVALSSTGIAYIIARERNGPSTLHAYNPDGSARWEVPLANDTSASWAPVGPVIGPDGIVYAASDDQTAPALFAIDDGKKLWSVPLAARAEHLIVGPEGRLFVHIPAGNIAAFDSRGQKLW
ncbi:MAG: PQQ-binding-like beta-propeller repeat protein, partial [Candidatus Acidiferrum sp.]